MSINYGLCTRSFEQSIKTSRLDIFDVIELAVDQDLKNIDFLSIHIPSDDIARKVASILKKLGVKTVNYSTRLVVQDFCDFTYDVYQQEFIKASILGSPFIGIRINSKNEKKDYASIRDDIMGKYAQLSTLAEQNNIHLIIENVHGLSQNPDILLDMYKSFEGKISLCVDTGNFPQNQLYSYTRLLASYMSHCHLKFLQVDKSGMDRNFDIPILLDFIKEQDYTGCVAIEYEGSEDEIFSVKSACSYLMQLRN